METMTKHVEKAAEREGIVRCRVCKGTGERAKGGSRMMARPTKRKPCTGCNGYGYLKAVR